MDRQPASAQISAIDDVVVDERRRMDELDNRCVEDGAVALVAAEPGRHQQHGGPDTLAAALLNVAAYLGNQRYARLDVANEFLLNGVEIVADGLEDLRQ